MIPNLDRWLGIEATGFDLAKKHPAEELGPASKLTELRRAEIFLVADGLHSLEVPHHHQRDIGFSGDGDASSLGLFTLILALSIRRCIEG